MDETVTQEPQVESSIEPEVVESEVVDSGVEPEVVTEPSPDETTLPPQPAPVAIADDRNVDVGSDSCSA